MVLLISAMGVMTASAQEAIDPGTANTNFTVMNLDASETAEVIAEYVNQSGVVDATRSVTITAQSSYGFTAPDSGLDDGWIGSVVASSGNEIVAFAQTRWQNGSSDDGKVAAAYNGFTEGAQKLYFPSLAARSGKQYSLLSVQSAEGASSSETIDITITYYDRNGGLSKTVNDTLYKGAQKTYNLLDESLPNVVADGWIGSVVVESDDPIAGVAVTHWTQYSAAYSGVTGGGTKIYLPSATRRLPAGTWLQYTGLVVQNLNATITGTVQVTWYDRTGNQLHVFTDTIPANSSHGYNTKQPANTPDPDALHTALGDDWNGSVVVESLTAGVDIMAVANLQWTADHPAKAGAASYTSAPGGFAELFIPATFRTRTGDVETGSWRQYTGLIVQNIGTTACSDFTVEWRNRDGDLLMDYTDSLDPNISHGYNTKTGGDLNGLGEDPADLLADFRGSVYINAPGCELTAIHNTIWPAWTDNTTYSAFGK